MRSIAEQDDAELGGGMSVLVRQKRDHVALDALLHELGRTEGDQQQEVLNRLGRLVFSHAFAEEAVLWPTVRRVLPDGEALTLRIEKEHQEINELWVQLETATDRTTRQPLLDRLVEVLREDVRDEEDLLLPRLQERLDARALTRLGWTWEAVRRTAPTRPHPVVARRPPGNALSALPLSVLDRSRDRVDQVARRSGPQARPRLLAASRVLAKLAGAVEQLPPMKRGEDPSTHRTG
ncbi:MAG TPA: hemerythrin domain-containing protein [Nocardioidaceae bacterium]|nr:hemerythrin domain-containing protein [Nocardioidaceae bacterium]